MTKDQFKEKVKQLAVDYWNMNLHDGTFEEKLTEIIDEYEYSPSYETITTDNVTCVIHSVDIHGNCFKCGRNINDIKS